MLNRAMANKTSSLVFTLAFCSSFLAAMPGARAEDLAALALQAAKERGGGGAPLVTEDGKLGAAEMQRFLVKLEPRQCVVAAAAGAETSDIELSVRTPEGLSLGDGEAGPVARLRYCAGTNAEKAQVRVRSEQASGYALGVWPVQTGTDAPPSAASKPADKAQPTLPQLLSQASRDHAKGLAAMTAPREEDLGSGDARERDLPIEGGRCYRVLAVADAKALGVTLALTDKKGVAHKALQVGENLAVLGEEKPLCPSEATSVKLTIAVREGAGRVLWQVFGAPDPQVISRWKVGGDGDSMVASRIRSSHERMGEAKPAAMALQSGKLATAEGAEAAFDVQPGHCYIAIAAGTPSVRSLDIEIVDQRGNIVAQALDQGGLAKARVCSDLKARWTVKLRLFKGYGEYALQVFGGP